MLICICVDAPNARLLPAEWVGRRLHGIPCNGLLTAVSCRVGTGTLTPVLIKGRKRCSLLGHLSSHNFLVETNKHVLVVHISLWEDSHSLV